MSSKTPSYTAKEIIKLLEKKDLFSTEVPVVIYSIRSLTEANV
jgi:hypothetical protein